MTNRTTPVGTVDEELVERIAVECHHTACQNVPRFNPDYRREAMPWDKVPPNGQAAWRAVARAAIEASGLEQLSNRVERLERELDWAADYDPTLVELIRARAALTGEHPPISRVDEYPTEEME